MFLRYNISASTLTGTDTSTDVYIQNLGQFNTCANYDTQGALKYYAELKIGMFIAGFFLIWQNNDCDNNNQRSVFGNESFDHLDFDSNYLDTKNLFKMFDERSNVAKWVTRIFIFILLFSGGVRFVLIKPESYHYWVWIRIIALLRHLICQFGMFIGPSMFYDLKHSISINFDSIEDKKLLSNQSAQDSVNKLIGYAFSDICVLYLSNILYLMLNKNTILDEINEKSKSHGTKGIDTIMDDVIGDDGSDSESNSRIEVILNTLVSVSNNVLQNCFKGNVNELGREARKQKVNDDDVNNEITLSHIENRSDVIDVDENELLATEGGMDNNVSKSSLEADLLNRSTCIIGRQPIINDRNNKQIINKNSIFYSRFLGGMLNIKHSVEKIEELHKKNEQPAINNARAPLLVGSVYFESIGPDTWTKFITAVRQSDVGRGTVGADNLNDIDESDDVDNNDSKSRIH